jgi:energy-coupling factor transporter ATP-binding protein EcfA2
MNTVPLRGTAGCRNKAPHDKRRTQGRPEVLRQSRGDPWRESHDRRRPIRSACWAVGMRKIYAAALHRRAEPVTSGKLLLDGVDMTTADPVTRGVAMVFQSYALYTHMTVAENIGFGLKIAGENKSTVEARVLEIAKFLKLEELLARKPKTLSGGQRQRVAIGRALARKPRIFLFDEPLSNLDASLRAEMRVELAKTSQPTRQHDDLCDPRSGRSHDLG